MCEYYIRSHFGPVPPHPQCPFCGVIHHPFAEFLGHPEALQSWEKLKMDGQKKKKVADMQCCPIISGCLFGYQSVIPPKSFLKFDQIIPVVLKLCRSAAGSPWWSIVPGGPGCWHLGHATILCDPLWHCSGEWGRGCCKRRLLWSWYIWELLGYTLHNVYSIVHPKVTTP